MPLGPLHPGCSLYHYDEHHLSLILSFLVSRCFFPNSIAFPLQESSAAGCTFQQHAARTQSYCHVTSSGHPTRARCLALPHGSSTAAVGPKEEQAQLRHPFSIGQSSARQISGLAVPQLLPELSLLTLAQLLVCTHEGPVVGPFALHQARQRLLRMACNMGR